MLFQVQLPIGITQGVIKEVVYFLLGACELSTEFAFKQLFCEAKGVGNKFHPLPGSLPSPSRLPLCSSQGKEFLSIDVAELDKWWLLLLLCSLVMLLKNTELLSQLVNSLSSPVLNVWGLDDFLLLTDRSAP